VSLPRAIPEPVKREVRQRCGFGCVICGKPLYDYDHKLGFSKVRRHVAEQITLLCPTHHADECLMVAGGPLHWRMSLPNPVGIFGRSHPILGSDSGHRLYHATGVNESAIRRCGTGDGTAGDPRAFPAGAGAQGVSAMGSKQPHFTVLLDLLWTCLNLQSV
jgi:hypothetical protein